MSKPNVDAIRAALPLTRRHTRGDDPLAQCNICGQPSERLEAWREHNERDLPIEGPGALVFLGGDHPECRKALDEHPRLYDQRTGDPGTFPLLCGPCTLRRGLGCAHADLRSNGGAGLNVSLDGYAIRVHIRGRGCQTLLRSAVRCVGRRTLSLVTNVPEVERRRCGFCGCWEDAHASELVPGGFAFDNARPCRCGRCQNFVPAVLPATRHGK